MTKDNKKNPAKEEKEIKETAEIINSNQNEKSPLDSPPVEKIPTEDQKTESEETVLAPEQTFSFQGQQTDEKVLFLGHEHWLILMMSIIKMLILAGILSLAVFGILMISKLDWRYTFIGALALIFIGSFFINHLHKNTYFIITNQRVILSRQLGIFKNRTHSVNLTKIKETAFTQEGALGSIFKFGGMTIQSDVEFPENRQMTFENLSHVKDAKFFLDKIVALVEQGHLRADLPEFVNAAKGKRY